MMSQGLTRRTLGGIAAGGALSLSGLAPSTEAEAATADSSHDYRAGSLRRYVIGTGSDGRSYMQFSGTVTAGGVALPGGGFAASLWATHEMPVDNTGTTDEAGSSRGPGVGPDGTSFGFVYHPAGQPATQALMHRTPTTDYWVVLAGHAILVTDNDNIHLRAGDTVVVRGATHGWAHPAGQLFLGVSVSLDAIPTTAPAPNGHPTS
jgi:mannose-6-phosphate isomerase-like protein (cupin superfamily)